MLPEAPGEGPSGFSQQFPDTILVLAEAWKGSDPRYFLKTPGVEGEQKASQLPAELADLRDRAARDFWSRFLNASELTQPPLADQPPETAIVNLCQTLAMDGKWRRLLELLSTRGFAASIPQSGPMSKAAI